MNRTLQQLIRWVKDLKVFKRNKKPILTKLVSALLYQAGLSCRETASVQSLVTKVSHETVRNWYKALSEVIPDVEPKRRETVAVDETKLKVNGKHVYGWAAMHIETKEILAVKATVSRSSLEAYLFMRKVKSKCVNRARLLTDKGPWYNPWTVKGFEHEHMIFGLRNCIERWFRTLKERTRRFYNNVNCKDVKSGIECLKAFLLSFAGLYNLMLSP